MAGGGHHRRATAAVQGGRPAATGQGKGNKIIGIPGDRVASREEYLADLAVLPAGATLVLQAGKRTLSLKADDLEHYKGERGRRGNKLPRGFQRVDALLVEVQG